MRRDKPDKTSGSRFAEVGARALGRQIAAVKAKLQRMNPVEEQAAHYRLFGDLMMLEQRRKTLLERATGV